MDRADVGDEVLTIVDEKGDEFTNFHAVEDTEVTSDYTLKFHVDEVNRKHADQLKGRRLFSGRKVKPNRFIPEGIPLDFINLQEKDGGGDDIVVYFKCKKKCDTIFTREKIEEMNRFVEVMTSKPFWRKHCRRDKNERYEDGFGCTRSSYANITKYIHDQFKDRPEYTQEDID